jgi:hypothetical protein
LTAWTRSTIPAFDRSLRSTVKPACRSSGSGRRGQVIRQHPERERFRQPLPGPEHRVRRADVVEQKHLPAGRRSPRRSAKFALRETATRQAVASTCGDAFSDTVSAVLIGPGRLHFTPRTTPRPRSSDVNEMLPSLDVPMS